MKFRTELQLKNPIVGICYSDNIVMLGSCFAENIGAKLKQIKYKTTINPLGINYHPLPLHKSIIAALEGKRISTHDLKLNVDGQYTAWNVHSRLSSLNLDETISTINDGIETLYKCILDADHIVLTYGTSYYYDHKQHGPVANCHKFPSTDFEKKLSTPEEILESYNDMLNVVRKLNPSVNMLLTVSPVRHIKDGIIENGRSKAHLLTAVHQICDSHKNCHYLPSYELLMDDLRDYRYYAEDMVHPSPMAIDYIWEKIGNFILDSKEVRLRESITKIVKAASHRPFNESSKNHRKFLTTQANAIEAILKSYPNLDFSREMKIFRN